LPQWLIYVLIFWGGTQVGFLLKAFLSYRFAHYSGVMYITHEGDKKLYSLELYETVEDLDSQTSITFKVASPE
jgi:hypothetical protein